VPGVQDVTALAALAQAFVAYVLDAYRRGIAFEPVERWILCENRWRAARFGTESELIAKSPLPRARFTSQQRNPSDTAGPRPSNLETLKLQSIQSIVAEIVEYLMPAATQLGTARYLEQCQRIAQNGSAADRQLAIAGAGDPDLSGVVRQYCQETLDV
jgi:carboxylate-amine ligase